MKNHTDEVIEKLKNHTKGLTSDADICSHKPVLELAIAELEKLNTEIKFYRDYIHTNGLEFDAMNKYVTWLKLQ